MSPSHNHRAALVVGALLAGCAAGAAGAYWLMAPRAPNASARPPDAQDRSSANAAADADQHDHSDHAHHHGDDAHDHAPAAELIRLSPQAARVAGIEIAEAAGGVLEKSLTLPGEIVLNADTLAHIVPRAAGIAREVLATLGDVVTAGQTLAVLDSRELAEAKAADLAAEARLALAEANMQRLEELRAQKIVAEQQYLETQQRLAEAQIEHRTTEAKLHALGQSEEQVRLLSQEPHTLFSRYEITAPFSGEVIEKHITRGEVVSSDTDVFVVANLSTVWADITVYAHELPGVRVGQEVVIRTQAADQEQRGGIIYVSPLIHEATRTGTARAVIPNEDRRWRPGMFVTADLVVESEEVAVLALEEAIQTIDNQPVVFVEEPGGFEPRRVTLGRRNARRVEILSGLVPGDRYVAKGSFVLKAELGKAAAEHQH